MAIAELLCNSSPVMVNRAPPGPVNYAQLPQLAERGLVRGCFFADLNARLSERESVVTQQFSIADITAVVAVDFARIVKIKPDRRHPHLLRWRSASANDGLTKQVVVVLLG